MANEEQRRAFASYMGTADTSAGQQTPQYSGAYANSGGNPYLFQQFPGVSGLPTAPTPPPAASSSVDSYPSYTGGLQGAYQSAYQGGYPQAGFQQGGYQQNSVPRRPPPLGQGEGYSSQQQSQQQAGQSSYGQATGNYTHQPYPSQAYNAGYQYSDPMARHHGHSNGDTVSRSAMVPSSRNFPGEVVESRSKHVNEQYSYHEYAQPAPAEAPPPTDTVPVLLCHTCSVCGQMRSAGYHRHNPVVPGKPLVLTPCRKCKKKTKSRHRSVSVTRVRSCTADVPCDWPAEDVRIDIDQYERRGRRRSRDTVYVYRHSPSRPRIVRHSSSQTKLGLRALQQESRPEEMRRTTKIRVSSMSPRRASRYVGIHPPPDVVIPARVQEMRPPPPTNANNHAPDEVWPPPDGVHAHLFRKVERSLSRRPRIIELTPSPPPVRTRSVRHVYRSQSVEHRRRSDSPARVIIREERRTEEARERMSSHPRAYRAVHPEERNFREASDETSVGMDELYQARRRRRESPSEGILKDAPSERSRRTTMRESQQSTAVEVGGPRVHFNGGRRTEQVEERGRSRHADDARRSGEDFELRHNYTRHQYVDEPPVEEMERVRIRRQSQSPRRAMAENIRIRRQSQSPRRVMAEEIRIDRARRISPSPRRGEEIRHAEELHIRHIAPRERAPPPPEPERRIAGFRHVSREEVVTRARSVTPQSSSRRPAEDDMTDSESGRSGEVVETRSWRGIDENGKPAIFVEERRRVRMLEGGSERGGREEFRTLNERERVPVRTWRDV